MTRRIVAIEEPCEHGRVGECLLWVNGTPASTACPGGFRRVLTEGEYLLVEKVGGEWPGWAIRALDSTVPAWDEASDSVVELPAILDALADQGET